MEETIHSQDTELRQLVSFMLDKEEFGVEILKVKEIIRPREITQLPESPAFVDGIINLRDQVIPVVNLRRRFGFAALKVTRESRIIVVEIQERVIGFTVDAVCEVLRLPAGSIEPAPDLSGSINTAYISGVAKLEKRLLIFLDLDKVLSLKELEALEAVV